MTDAAAAPQTFPCAQCGAALSYEPGADQLTCPYCGHVQEIERQSGPWGDEPGAVAENDYAAALSESAGAAETEETSVYRCENCGAATSFPPDVQADRCPFCAAPIVTGAAQRRQFKPGGVLPFVLDQKEARQALKRWLEGLWFAPGDVGAFARAGRPLDGVYLPFWTFDADADSRYDGERGDVYHVDQWVTVMRDGKPTRVKRRVPKVRWTRVSGRVRRFFDDVLVIASRSLPERFAKRLGASAWDMAGLEPYRPDYLAGFRAEVYSVDLQEGFNAARAIMDMTIRRDVRFDIGGDRQRVHRIDTTVRDVTFKHVLLPVWIAAYRYRDKSYRFVVNGRTGEVIGERPYSAWKIALAVLGAVVVLGALAALYAAYGDGF